MDTSPATSRSSVTAVDSSQACSKGELVRKITSITWIGLGVNVFLALLKGVAGILSGSRVLLADAFHSLSDLVSDVAILIGVRYWLAPPDSEHPYGHQKIEALITLAIGLGLVIVGLGLGYEALVNLLRDSGSARSRSEPLLVNAVTWLALGAALISLISKEALYRWTAARGRALGSSALLANAWHHRSDALSSIPAVVAIGGSIFGSKLGYNFWYLDPVGTLVVCLLLCKAAFEVIRPALDNLIDTGAGFRLCKAIEEVCLNTPGVCSFHKIRTRYISSGTVAVDLHIQVDGALTVTRGHDLASEVKHGILELKLKGLSTRAVDVVVHVEPADD